MGVTRMQKCVQDRDHRVLMNRPRAWTFTLALSAHQLCRPEEVTQAEFVLQFLHAENTNDNYLLSGLLRLKGIYVKCLVYL